MEKGNILESILSQHASIDEVTASAIAAIVARDVVAFKDKTFRTVRVETQSHDYQDTDIISDVPGAIISDDVVSAYALKTPVWSSSKFSSSVELIMNNASITFSANSNFTALPAAGETMYSSFYERSLRDHKFAGTSPYALMKDASSVPTFLFDALTDGGTRVAQVGDPVFEAAKDLVRGLNFKVIEDTQGIIGINGSTDSSNNLAPYAPSKDRYSKPGYESRLPFTASVGIVTCVLTSGPSPYWARVSILVPVDGRSSHMLYFMPSVTDGKGVLPAKTWMETTTTAATAWISTSSWQYTTRKSWTRFTGLPFEEVRYSSCTLHDDLVNIKLSDDMSIKIGTATAQLPATLTRVYSISYYEMLLTGKMGKALGETSRDRMTKIIESWNTSGGAVSEVSYSVPQDVSAYRITDLEYAKSYKRQREKACKTDDFLTKKSPYMNLTFGEVQTKMNAIKTRKIWFLPKVSLTGDLPSVPSEGKVTVSYNETTKTVTVSGAASSSFVQDLNAAPTDAFADWVGDWMHLAYQNTDEVTRRVITAVHPEALVYVDEEVRQAAKFRVRGQELTAITPFSGQFGTIDVTNNGEMIKTHAANCTVYSNTEQQLKLLRMQFTLGKIERNFV